MFLLFQATEFLNKLPISVKEEANERVIREVLPSPPSTTTATMISNQTISSPLLSTAERLNKILTSTNDENTEVDSFNRQRVKANKVPYPMISLPDNENYWYEGWHNVENNIQNNNGLVIVSTLSSSSSSSSSASVSPSSSSPSSPLSSTSSSSPSPTLPAKQSNSASNIKQIKTLTKSKSTPNSTSSPRIPPTVYSSFDFDFNGEQLNRDSFLEVNSKKPFAIYKS